MASTVASVTASTIPPAQIEAGDSSLEESTWNPTDPNKSKNEFRNYVDSHRQATVRAFYEANHKNQTYDFVISQNENFSKLDKMQMGIWEAAEFLNEIVDDSDPDTNLTQMEHNLQTAEAIRKEYPGEDMDWFVLTGFIHDLGKVLCHKNFGSQPQWSVVGDTFPVGCAFSSKCVFPEYFEANPDAHNPRFNTKFGVYSEGCGLDNVHMSWGHDEYFYLIAKQFSTLPISALYMIRYHSFYPLHRENEYGHLLNDVDRENLKWIREFNRFDLYSKSAERPDVNKLKPYYMKLIDKYFPKQVNW
jgi:inositol oxygenase